LQVIKILFDEIKGVLANVHFHFYGRTSIKYTHFQSIKIKSNGAYGGLRAVVSAACETGVSEH
jgi:hypothetical protein